MSSQIALYGGVADLIVKADRCTYIDSSTPTINNDTHDVLVGNSVNAAKFRGLYRWNDLATAATGHTVLSASLFRWVSSVSNNSGTFALRKLTGSGADFTEAQATWNSYATGSAWTAAGGDFTLAGEVHFTKPPLIDFGGGGYWHEILGGEISAMILAAINGSTALGLIEMSLNEAFAGNNFYGLQDDDSEGFEPRIALYWGGKKKVSSPSGASDLGPGKKR